MKKRKQLSASLRFDVFKRDSFRCQYCGASAPDALLHVDHIKPVVEGGENEITNLITACAGCNLGKGSRALSDGSTVIKAKRQLDELQERREQIEMMMRWRESLLDVHGETVQRLGKFWERLAPGWAISAAGFDRLGKVARQFSVDEVTVAMEAAASYLRRGEDGGVAQDSWETAFNKIGAICRVKRDCAGNPDREELYRLRGLLRYRIPGYFKPGLAMEFLESALSWGATVPEIRSACSNCTSWTKFTNAIFRVIEEAKERAE